MSDQEPTLEEAAAEVARLVAESEALTAELAQSAGTDIVPASGNLPADQMKARLAEARSALVHKRAELDRAQAALRARLDAQIAQAAAAIAPMKEMVERLEEGIAAVNLYVGRDEEIVTLASGEPAPAPTPITVRQMVLAMDEETAIAAEDGGIDVTNLNAFDAWLLADPAHLDQVLPEPRGVVVLQPRRTDKRYGDPWTDMQMNDANKSSYWLIRNGENLYRMTTDIRVGTHLIPTRDEFTSFFEDKRWVRDPGGNGGHYETVPLDPGSHAFLRAEKAADARQRHFMKTALVLQGLIDRTAVFHPLPAEQVSVLHADSYDAGHVNVVTDAELALGTGNEPFRDWLARLNAQLRPGMRVICAFRSDSWRHANEYERGRGHSRLRPKDAYPPESETILTIDSRTADGSLVVRYDRRDKRWGYEHGDWGEWGEWPYKQRASVVLDPSDRFVLPYDLVTVEEMERYLAARTERHAYAQMFPVLKAAIAAKRAETEAEAPFRRLVAGEIAKANDVDVAAAEEAVPGLVDWWKLANRHHRPLVDPDPAVQAKAIRMIVREDALRRRAAGDDTTDADTVTSVRAEHPDALLVAVKRDGSRVAFVPADPGNVFVHVREWTKTGKARPGKDWVLPGARTKSWRVLWTSDRWDDWDHTATLSLHLTAPEQTDILPAVLERAGARVRNDDTDPVAVTYNTRRREFTVYFDDIQDRKDWFGRPTLPSCTAIHLPWRRTRGSAPTVDGNGWASTETWSTRDPWPWPTDSGDGTTPVVVHAATTEREPLVWIDTSRLPGLLGFRDEYLASVTEANKQSRLVSVVIDAVVAAWEEQTWAAEHARFLDDYQDPSLWEDHRKSIRLPHSVERAIRQDLREQVEVLIGGDVDVNGMTVADVSAAAARVEPDRAWRALPDEIADITLTITPGEDDEETDDGW